MCLLNLHGIDHGCSDIAMRRLMMSLLGCFSHARISVVYALLCMSLFICMHCHGYGYACMVG